MSSWTLRAFSKRSLTWNELQPKIKWFLLNLEKFYLNRKNIHNVSDKNKTNVVKFPALNIKVVDTLGAGDAVYSYTSCLIKNGCDPKLIAIVGAIAGALKTNILGHSNWVSLKQVERSLEAILK